MERTSPPKTRSSSACRSFAQPHLPAEDLCTIGSRCPEQELVWCRSEETRLRSRFALASCRFQNVPGLCERVDHRIHAIGHPSITARTGLLRSIPIDSFIALKRKFRQRRTATVTVLRARGV